ncbi:hypothetical protein V5799_017944, partial [Amblyomma americanum]
MEDLDEADRVDDLSVPMPDVHTTSLPGWWTATMQEELLQNLLNCYDAQVETEITATTATPAENGLAAASDEAEPMKAGVLSGEVAPTVVIGGCTPQQQQPQAPPFSTDVPPPKPGVPRAILTCRPNSHPFPERVLNLDQPAKVGRSVARCRQAPNNAIFDCKVLSRNHALLWYEGGKFYLQDTKSSNGTFVNNQRLSKGSEESPAQEVCSGDIVQFGVDVVENSRK